MCSLQRNSRHPYASDQREDPNQGMRTFEPSHGLGVLRFSLWMIGFLLVDLVGAEEPPSNIELKSAPCLSPCNELVRQLGDEDFATRERATQSVLAWGPLARPALLSGMYETELEIHWRCRRLWKEIHESDFHERASRFLGEMSDASRYDFPGWQLYRSRLGASRESRELFLEMQQAEPVIWAELESDEEISSSLFCELVVRLQAKPSDFSAQEKVGLGTAATLLFLSALRPREYTMTEIETVNRALDVPIVQDRLRQGESIGKLQKTWREVHSERLNVEQRLMRALRDSQADEAQQAAREILRIPDSPAIQKQYALIALAASGDSDDLDLIEQCLEDSTMLDTYLTRGVVLRSELRDVALAVMVVRSGLDPRDFGFEYLRSDLNSPEVVSKLGFADPSQRESAFQRWAEMRKSVSAQSPSP